MYNFAAHILEGGNVVWDLMGNFPQEKNGITYKEGITFNFSFDEHLSNSQINKKILYLVRNSNIPWLNYAQEKWIFLPEKFKDQFPNFQDYSWVDGSIELFPEYEYSRSCYNNKNTSRIKFMIIPELIMQYTPKKIFLSHKSEDKEKIRLYKSALESVGLTVWLDEDDMPAGASLHRKILMGIKESCAIVFFITPLFSDRDYLAREIELAIDEKIKRKESFSIIALLLADDNGKMGEAPKLLSLYVYKQINNDLDGFQKIIKALPLNFSDRLLNFK